MSFEILLCFSGSGREIESERNIGWGEDVKMLPKAFLYAASHTAANIRVCLWRFINRPDKFLWPEVSIPEDKARAPRSACCSSPRLGSRDAKVLQVFQDVELLSPRGSRPGLETATTRGRSAVPVA